MADVFISYASVDRNQAKRLAEHLQQHGYSVWWDRTIPPGRVFDEVIQEALDAAQCVVVLWSQASIASNWVKAESADALTNQRLVPALIAKVSPPIEFRRIQAADLTQWDGADNHAEVINLRAAIDRLVHGKGKGESSSTPRDNAKTASQAALGSNTSHSSRRTLQIGAALCVLAVVAAIVLTNSQRRSSTASSDHEPTDATSTGIAANVVASAASLNPSSVATSSPSNASIVSDKRRTNLLLPDNGGQLLVASTDRWNTLLSGEGESSIWIDNGIGVFGFKHGRAARFDTFAMLIPLAADNNVKDFELYAGNDSPTGQFELIGKFTVQNIRVMQQPYQEFHFTPVTAKYLKVHALSSYGGSSTAVLAYRFQLFGTLQ